MFGFIKGLLSSGEIVKGGMKAMDMLVLTAEEKIQYNLKYLAATMPMNRARRFIAISITSMWLLHSAVALILFLIGSPNFADFMQHMLTNITVPFGIVVTFYLNANKGIK